MPVFNSDNISEKQVTEFFTEKGIPGSEAAFISKVVEEINKKSKVNFLLFDPDQIPFGIYEEPTIGIVGDFGSIDNNTLSEIKSVWISFYPFDEDGWVQLWPIDISNSISEIVNALEARSFLTASNIVSELQDKGYTNKACRFEVNQVFSSSITPPSLAPTVPNDEIQKTTIRAYTQFDSFNNTSTIHEVWMYVPINFIGSWIKIYPTGAGASDARSLNTSFSPNGLITSTHRGEIFITGTISNDFVSTTGAKTWIALNGNSNNSWQQTS